LVTEFSEMAEATACVRVKHWAVLAVALLAGFASLPASAAECPGNPNAIGTSRTLVVDPREHRLIGTMQYRETLPLADHEVVLTFDDGPLPRNSNQVLDILASQCVKATFFIIGQMAQSSPEGVRKLFAAGHSIGTHTQTHPLSMDRMPIERAMQQIDDGIASTRAALGENADALAPFFRIPGLLRADKVEDYLASQGIQTWSADFPADDWHRISPQRVHDFAINRLEAKGKGILLLHDIQARTVAALPRILDTLKARGYHIVHVVPATAERPATRTEPQQWLLHPDPETIAQWPTVPNFVFADLGNVSVPARANFNPAEGAPTLQVSMSRPSWPEPAEIALDNAAMMLAAPAENLFEVEGNLDVALRGAARIPHRAQRMASNKRWASKQRTVNSRPFSRREARRLAIREARFARHSGRQFRYGGYEHSWQKPSAAAARRGSLKRLVQVKKRRHA
jgi:peptidoglycan-N-acetylglucosamine deacetylase